MGAKLPQSCSLARFCLLARSGHSSGQLEAKGESNCPLNLAQSRPMESPPGRQCLGAAGNARSSPQNGAKGTGSQLSSFNFMPISIGGHSIGSPPLV